MSMYDYVDDTVRLDNGLIVQRYSILTTPIVMHVVYEPATNYPNRTHSTITWIDGQPFGSYCSAELPAEIEALPTPSQERLDATVAWWQTRSAEAAATIAQAFPYTAGQKPDMMGRIEMTLDTIERQVQR